MSDSSLAKIFHWGPISALALIKSITGMTIHCCAMWWPSNTTGGAVNLFIFMGLSGFTLYNFLSAIFHGPGHLPLGWKPVKEEDTKYLQFCSICNCYKAPRSHHCRKCKRCILKMDHHCPWINNCVGWANHAHFISFLIFAIIGCGHAAVILGCSFYRSLYRFYYLRSGITNMPIVHLGFYGSIFCLLAFSFAIGVVISVGILLYFQLKAVIKNSTAIEDWIVEKANHRRLATGEKFVFPYNLGFFKNVQEVLNFSCVPVGNGIDWPVAEGCDQYSLTKEQLAQKVEKRIRTKMYDIIHPASGSWFPLFQGICTFFQPPCTDEPRIKLVEGDKILVTRWRKYWLFGEKCVSDNGCPDQKNDNPRIKGWFPRRCAIEFIQNDSILNSDSKKEQ